MPEIQLWTRRKILHIINHSFNSWKKIKTRTVRMLPQSKKQLKSIITPIRIRTLVAEYVIKDMLPLSTVQSEAFTKLIAGFLLICFT